jgi:hypothetical protein
VETTEATRPPSSFFKTTTSEDTDAALKYGARRKDV